MTTITSQYGNTPVGQQTQNFQDILKTITGGAQTPMSPEMAQSGYQSALSNQLAMNVNQPQFMQQAQNTLTQQAGTPQLQSQYGDLAKLFPLYLADSNLASKYSNQGAPSPYANPALATTAGTTGAPNPYLASPEALGASATPTGGGFSSPGLVTSAMGAPVTAASNLMNMINSAIGIEGGIVKTKMGDVSANYQKALDTLGVLATVFGNAYTQSTAAGTAHTQALNDSMATDAQSGMTLDNLMKKYGTRTSHDDILKLYNTYSSWGQAKETRDQLANKYGISKAYLDELGLPTTKDLQKQKDNFKTASAAIKGFGDLANEYWNNSQDIFGARILNPTGKAAGSVEAMKKVYTGKLQQALKIGRGKYNFEQLMSSIPGDLTLSNKAEGQLRGHLSELLTNNDLIIARDNTGRTGLTDTNNFDPNSETEVDIMSEPFNNILSILKGL